MSFFFVSCPTFTYKHIRQHNLQVLKEFNNVLLPRRLTLDPKQNHFNCFLTVGSAAFLVPLQSVFHISQNEPVNLQVGLFHPSLENPPVGSWLNQRKSVLVTSHQYPLLTSGLGCLSDLISHISAPSTHF